MDHAKRVSGEKWRDAARARMYDATLAELRGRHGTEQVSFNYRWEHVTTVVTLALRLAELTGADAEIVEAAAWLHDICKYSDGNRHPIAGAAYARAFLPTTDFPPQKIAAVAQAIADHMGLWRDEPLTVLEAQVLWDADKLAKIGLTAVFHWTGGWLAGGEMRTLAGVIARGRDAEWQSKTVASMHTKPAQRAAAARLAAYHDLYDALERELTGADLVTPVS
ncbi:MAG: HD domain-containing protein [Candidatus Promineofilum sp.]|nr:HD domain-containing protein [Promineifilum sp.]